MTLQSDDPHILRGLDTIRTFVTAGRAVFTIRNTETGNRMTYRVIAEEGERFRVEVLTGSDNTSNYSLIGHVTKTGFHHQGLLQAALELKATVQEMLEGAGSEQAVDRLTFVKGFAGSMLRVAQGTDRAGMTPGRVQAWHGFRRSYNVEMSDLDATDMRVRGFGWLWRRLTQGQDLPDKVEVWHEGRCGKCSRRLTVPESIATGLGPVCASRLAA
jgi:hypothetical protein